MFLYDHQAWGRGGQSQRMIAEVETAVSVRHSKPKVRRKGVQG